MFPHSGWANRIGNYLSVCGEVAVRAGRKVLKETDNNVSLIAGDPQGILDQQLRPHPICFKNITIII